MSVYYDRDVDTNLIKDSARARQFVIGSVCAIAAVAIWAGWLVMMRLAVTTPEPDIEPISVSQTFGDDRTAEEVVVRFTHTLGGGRRKTRNRRRAARDDDGRGAR